MDGDGDRLLESAEHYREVSPIDFILSARAAATVLDATGRREDAREVLDESLGWCTKLGADLHLTTPSVLLCCAPLTLSAAVQRK